MKRAKIGDSIKFKAATRSHYKVAVRRVTGYYANGYTVTRYHGWSDFCVRADEVLEVLPQDKAA